MAVDNNLETVTDEMIPKAKKAPPKGLRHWWRQNWKGIVAELVSTFLLLFLGCMACVPVYRGTTDNTNPLYGALGFGMIVLINIQTFGHISGAFMNPAVTLAAVIWGNLSVAIGLVYSFVQVLGAISGYGALMLMSPVNLDGGQVCTTQPMGDGFGALGIEILLTASLVFISCNIWDPVNSDKVESNPIKLGLAVTGLSIAGGPLTGASMNPARSLAPAIWTNTWRGHWIYWVGPIAGSVLATLFYKRVWLKLEKIELPELPRTVNNNGEV